ncbi:hypothetical protein VUR80DRAFT_9312 [Thermomyces stellatus]
MPAATQQLRLPQIREYLQSHRRHAARGTGSACPANSQKSCSSYRVNWLEGSSARSPAADPCRGVIALGVVIPEPGRVLRRLVGGKKESR